MAQQKLENLVKIVNDAIVAQASGIQTARSTASQFEQFLDTAKKLVDEAKKERSLLFNQASQLAQAFKANPTSLLANQIAKLATTFVPNATKTIRETEEQVRRIEAEHKRQLEEARKEQAREELENWRREQDRLRREQEFRRQQAARARASTVRSDPHFIGFDGERYDIMPSREAVLMNLDLTRMFVDYNPEMDKVLEHLQSISLLAQEAQDQSHFEYIASDPEKKIYQSGLCITGIHKSAEGEGTQPSWMTAVIIKIFDNMIFFDVEGHFIVNGIPHSPDTVVIDQQELRVAFDFFKEGSHYLLKNDQLAIWVPEFGNILVENCAGFNLNLLIIQDVHTEVKTSAKSLLLGKEANKSQIYQRPLVEYETVDFLKTSGLPDADQEELLFDYMFTPKNIRDKVLQQNIAAVINQSEVVVKYNVDVKKFPVHPCYLPTKMVNESDLFSDLIATVRQQHFQEITRKQAEAHEEQAREAMCQKHGLASSTYQGCRVIQNSGGCSSVDWGANAVAEIYGEDATHYYIRERCGQRSANLEKAHVSVGSGGCWSIK